MSCAHESKHTKETNPQSRVVIVAGHRDASTDECRSLTWLKELLENNLKSRLSSCHEGEMQKTPTWPCIVSEVELKLSDLVIPHQV